MHTYKAKNPTKFIGHLKMVLSMRNWNWNAITIEITKTNQNHKHIYRNTKLKSHSNKFRNPPKKIPTIEDIHEIYLVVCSHLVASEHLNKENKQIENQNPIGYFRFTTWIVPLPKEEKKAPGLLKMSKMEAMTRMTLQIHFLSNQAKKQILALSVKQILSN